MKSELSCRDDDTIDLVFVDRKNDSTERISLVDAGDNSKQMRRMDDVSKKGRNESNHTHEDMHNEISKITENNDRSVEQSILTNNNSDIGEGRSCLKGVKEMNKISILRNFNTRRSVRSVSEVSSTLNDDSDDSTICEDPDDSDYDEILEKVETQSNESVNYECHTKDCEHVTQSLVDTSYYDQSGTETESQSHSIDENHFAPIKEGCDDDSDAIGDRKIFVCTSPGCNKSYTYLKSFVIHQQAHNGKKPYVCDEPGCGRGFNTLNSLKNHARVHSGEKPFKCDYPNCQKRFTHLRGMACHKKRQHSGKTGGSKAKRRKMKR
ncbi:8514_t:CDS:2 [Dentiscutata erythropus]|uniref:8514_t:CDS:1 n=1 Tax=Dentiscutata erythropus TaxID=1348616 RepID=A0A9N9FZW5_9GLOM|nr:8514_t:CDS:2 [Dentiscutata erythropus]